MKQKSLSVSGGCHYHGKKIVLRPLSVTSFEVLQAYKMHVSSMCLGCTKLGRWAKPCDATRAWMSTEALKFPKSVVAKELLDENKAHGCTLGTWALVPFPLHVTIFWMVTDLMMRTEISHLKNSIGERGAWRITREILIHSWISLQRIWLKLTSLSTAFPSDLRLRLKRWHQCFAWRP